MMQVTTYVIQSFGNPLFYQVDEDGDIDWVSEIEEATIYDYESVIKEVERIQRAVECYPVPYGSKE